MGVDWARGRRGWVAVGVVILFRRSRCNWRCRRAANRRRGTNTMRRESIATRSLWRKRLSPSFKKDVQTKLQSELRRRA